MAEHSEQAFFLKDLFPHAGPELLRLLQGAADNAFLLRSDFYTMLDWAEIGASAEEDVLHAMLLLMFVALEEGSLCIEVASEALNRRLRDLVPDDEALIWSQRIPAAIGQNAFSKLVGTSPGDHKPVILHKVNDRQFLYFQKFLRAELDFQAELMQRLNEPPVPSQANWATIVPSVLASQTLQLDREQQRALDAGLVNNLAIISGGPGTGKTSIVLTLLRCLIRGGVPVDRIRLAAPTGRAAQRLTESLRAGVNRLPSANDPTSPDAPLRDLSATTLHKLLAYRPARHLFAHHRENPIPADVVIVDEVSMVGLLLMAQLFKALAPATKLILLGDKDQLPSVEAGAVLAHLVPDVPAAGVTNLLQNRVVLLQTNHRSQEQIRAAADAINRQDAAVADRLPALHFTNDGTAEASWNKLEKDGGCWLLEQTQRTANELRGFLHHWMEQAYFRSRLEGASLADLVESIEVRDSMEDDPAGRKRLQQLFSLLDRFRLLTLVRDSAWGCDEINKFLDQSLRSRFDGDPRTALFAGAPVLITRNDETRGLFNGDVGITLRRHGGGLSVVFQRQDNFIAFPAESVPTHELGFALTVHKSQGSEYANVMVVLPPKGGKRLLTKELIYTAITRAKSLAILCGTKDVLKFAIEHKIERESGLLRFDV